MTETTMSKREHAGVVVVNNINKCTTPEQIASAERLIQNFFRLYDPTEELPLMRFLRQRSFEIAHSGKAYCP